MEVVRGLLADWVYLACNVQRRPDRALADNGGSKGLIPNCVLGIGFVALYGLLESVARAMRVHFFCDNFVAGIIPQQKWK